MSTTGASPSLATKEESWASGLGPDAHHFSQASGPFPDHLSSDGIEVLGRPGGAHVELVL